MLLLAALVACTTPMDPEHGHGAHDHPHADGVAPHDHAAGTPPHDAAPAAADPHAAHGDHMAAMAATRDALRATLGPAYDAPVPGLDAANVERGRALYVTHCASCHGDGGRGDGPAAASLTPTPGDLTDAFHARYYSDAGRVQIIRDGSAGTSMTGFGGMLGDVGVLDVYAYVRSLRPAVAAP